MKGRAEYVIAYVLSSNQPNNTLIVGVNNTLVLPFGRLNAGEAPENSAKYVLINCCKFDPEDTCVCGRVINGSDLYHVVQCYIEIMPALPHYCFIPTMEKACESLSTMMKMVTLLTHNVHPFFVMQVIPEHQGLQFKINLANNQ